MLTVIQSLLTAIVLFFSVVLVNLNDKHLKLLLFLQACATKSRMLAIAQL